MKGDEIMVKHNDALSQVIKYMVEKAVNGIFTGTPRDKMEEIGVSSGPLYTALKDMGIIRHGRGRTATWAIPQHIIDSYGDEK